MFHGWLHHLNNCSLRLRLFLFVLVPMIGVLLALGFSLMSHLEQEGERRMQKEVELIARALQAPLAHALQTKRDRNVETNLKSAFRIGSVYGVYVYDAAGHIVGTEGEVEPDHKLKSDIPHLLATGLRGGKYTHVAGRSVYSYFVPLKDPAGDTIGLLQITRRKSDFQDYLQRLRVRATIGLALGAVLMTAIILFGYHNAVGKALGELRRAMLRIQAGDHAHRAEGHGPREIATLAGAFNAMLDSMQGARREIQRRRASEQALEQKLRRSEKLAALGEVAAGVAHELGGPLSLIDGKAQRALRHREAGAGEMLRQIREQVRRTERLVQQMLEFGRPTKPQRKHIRADQLAEMTRRNLNERLAPRARLEFHGPRPGPEMFVDPFRVELALNNLVQNSLQAAPTGRVSLSWEQEAGGEDIVFRVADDGPGVPPDLRTAIFDPFFTTRRAARGNGLGLSVVQRIAEEHAARIEVGTSRWGGAEFCLSFPASLPEDGPDQKHRLQRMENH